MSVTTISRQASVDEIAAEMDRRGEVIERLEAEFHARSTQDAETIQALEARLALRDTFIAEKGLWNEFARSLRFSPVSEAS